MTEAYFLDINRAAVIITFKKIVPIHTEHPERFKEHFGTTVVCYRDGQSFEA